MTLTQYTCWCWSFHDVWINFLGFIIGLISRCCSRRASVERSLCLKWLTMSFPTSSIPAILFLNFPDDALQVTTPKAPFCVQNFFPEAPSLQPGRERCTATTSWCSMAKATVAVVSRHEVSSRLARQCGSQEKQQVQVNGSNLQALLNKVRTLGCKSSLKRQTQGDWKEIAKLKAKYSILDLPLPACAAAVSFVATLFAGVDLQGSDGRGVSQLPICADTLFFCSTNVR